MIAYYETRYHGSIDGTSDRTDTSTTTSDYIYRFYADVVGDLFDSALSLQLKNWRWYHVFSTQIAPVYLGYTIFIAAMIWRTQERLNHEQRRRRKRRFWIQKLRAA